MGYVTAKRNRSVFTVPPAIFHQKGRAESVIREVLFIPQMSWIRLWNVRCNEKTRPVVNVAQGCTIQIMELYILEKVIRNPQVSKEVPPGKKADNYRPVYLITVESELCRKVDQ